MGDIWFFYKDTFIMQKLSNLLVYIWHYNPNVSSKRAHETYILQGNQIQTIWQGD